MAKSSIHIARGNRGYFFHNDRSKKTKNTIFHFAENEVDVSGEDAAKNFTKISKKRVRKYEKRTGKKLHAKTVVHMSAIVNLNEHHTLDDLAPVKDYLESEFGAKVVQMAIHRDEGHRKGARPVVNYHAHIEMVGLDAEGRSVRKKLTPGTLSALQSFVADALGMERGKNYAKERAKRPKRLDTYEYKAAKEAEEKIVSDQKAKIKDLKEEMAALRADMQEMGALRADYARLEAVNKMLREQIKAKDLTIEELKQAINEQKRQFEQEKAYGEYLGMELSNIDDIDEVKGNIIDEQELELSSKESDLIDMRIKLDAAIKELKQAKMDMSSLTKELSRMMMKNGKLQDEIKKLKSENKKLQSDQVYAFVNQLKDDVQEYKKGNQENLPTLPKNYKPLKPKFR